MVPNSFIKPLMAKESAVNPLKSNNALAVCVCVCVSRAGHAPYWQSKWSQMEA